MERKISYNYCRLEAKATSVLVIALSDRSIMIVVYIYAFAIG